MPQLLPLNTSPVPLSSQTAEDPYLKPAYPFRDRVRRLLWNLCSLLFYRSSPRPLHAWRAMLLRLFGATLGADCHFYPKARIWAPWNLVCEDHVTVGDEAEVYNPSTVHMASHAIVSQGAYLCCATHDYNDPAFPLISYPMRLGAYSWICARACVAPRANVGEGAVLGLASVATRDLEPWTVYAGLPAIAVKHRTRNHRPQETRAEGTSSCDEAVTGIRATPAAADSAASDA